MHDTPFSRLSEIARQTNEILEDDRHKASDFFFKLIEHINDKMGIPDGHVGIPSKENEETTTLPLKNEKIELPFSSGRKFKQEILFAFDVGHGRTKFFRTHIGVFFLGDTIEATTEDGRKFICDRNRLPDIFDDIAEDLERIIERRIAIPF